ncbi:MAG: ABC transporter ATP-binding protein [Spirochaetales bacterium]|nr:ABC transporter ATP-binding protein [Spirochaetales bacterium]
MNELSALVDLLNKKNKLLMLASIITCILSVAFGIIPYFGVFGIVSEFLKDYSEPTVLFKYVIAITIAIILKHLLHGTSTKISHRVAYQTLGETRKKMFKKISSLPMGYVKTTASGEIKTMIMDHTEQLETFYAHNIPEVISGLVIPICMEIAVFNLNRRVGFITLIPVALFFISSAIMIVVQIRKIDDYNNSVADLNANTIEYTHGMKELKIFAADDATYDNFSKSIRNYSEMIIQWFKSCLGYVAFNHADLTANLVFLFPLGGLMFLNQGLTAASFIMFLFMGLAMLIPLEKIADNLDYIGVNASVAKKIVDLLNEEELPDTGVEKSLKGYDIKFDNVDFSYNQDSKILDNVTFTAKEKTVTALVGVSGSGKSTLASLIYRFWDVSQGQISMGGIPLKEMSLSQLMNSTSFVTQGNFLFKKTIRENIMLGNQGATEEEMIEASKSAVCHDFISKLPHGYDTIVDKETKLSGGEKQRITIARAILKKAPVVILDEATAYIDPDNEDLLQKALAKLSENKTVLVIAHRLSSIKNADSIIVLENGKVITQGTHEVLIQDCKAYQSMWDAFNQSDNWKMGGSAS